MALKQKNRKQKEKENKYSIKITLLKWLRRIHHQLDRSTMDSCWDIWRMFANWSFRRAHLSMWVCRSVAPSRLAHLRLNTFLSMARSSLPRWLFVDFGSIGSLESLSRNRRRCGSATLHRSSTRTHPSTLDCSWARQHGNRDLFDGQGRKDKKSFLLVLLCCQSFGVHT